MKFGSRHDFHVVDGIIDGFLFIGKLPKGIAACGRGIAAAWKWLVALDMHMLIRRSLKVTTVVLVLYAMFTLLYPTQYRGWQLWLGPHETPLAKSTAVVLVGFNAMILTLVREAWANKHRALAIGGGVLGVMLMIVVLGGSWNYYTATSSRAVNVSSTATSGASSRVADAQKKLDDFDKQTANDAATFTAKIANADPRYVTATSKLVAAAKDASAAAAGQRVLLVGELNEARTGDVSANSDQFDPRPIDATMAKWFKVDRLFMGSLNDLARALCFELLAIFGLSLSMSAALSDVGAPVRAEPIREPLGDGLRIEDHSREADLAEQPYDRAVATAEFEDIEDGFHFVRGGKRKNPRRKSRPQFDETGVEAAATSSKFTDTQARAPVAPVWTVPTNMAPIEPGPSSAVEPGQSQLDFAMGGPREMEDGPDASNAAETVDSAALSLPGADALGGNSPEPAPAVVSHSDGDGDLAGAQDESADEPGPHADSPMASEPAPLPAAEFDRLVDAGVISEDGVPLSQEHVESIEQPDRAPRRPMLPAPSEMADAK